MLNIFGGLIFCFSLAKKSGAATFYFVELFGSDMQYFL